MTPKQATEFVKTLRTVISDKLDKRVRNPLKNVITVNPTATGYTITIDDPVWKRTFESKIGNIIGEMRRNDPSLVIDNDRIDDIMLTQLVKEAKKRYRIANFRSASVK